MTNLDEAVMSQIDYATFVKIISNIPSCIFFKDTELKYRFSSHCWAQLNSDNIVGKSDLEIRKDTENAMLAMEADREILRTKKGTDYIIKSVVDGDTSYLQLIKEPILGDDGEAIGIVGLINDVTEKTLLDKKILEMSKELEKKCEELEKSNEELKNTLDKLEKLNQATRMFTASMNHELRSPLNGIIGILQLLMEDATLNADQHENVFNAFQSSQLMLNIVNELLDYAKMEVSDFTINQEPFSIRDVVNNVEFLSANQAKAKGMNLVTRVDDSVAERLIGDENRIKQIILNYVSNAIKYSDDGTVTLSIEYKDGQLIIDCTDEGQGMSEASMKSLFDPYVRFNEKKNANIQGTGLGLSIVKKLVDKMGGEIQVKSELNVGTTFTTMIPLAVCEESASGKSEVQERGLDSLTALCVDDTTVNAIVLSAHLKKVGMRADTANSGKAALTLAQENKYDIIFMDHFMPQMDGVETLKAIRENCPLNSSTPIVMITGNASESCLNLYEEVGASGYILKPVVREQLFEVIRRVVN